MADAFVWPCDRRDAHAPHQAEKIVQPGTRTDSRYVRVFDCPGVLAHPATMIGGNHSGEQP